MTVLLTILWIILLWVVCGTITLKLSTMAFRGNAMRNVYCFWCRDRRRYPNLHNSTTHCEFYNFNKSRHDKWAPAEAAVVGSLWPFLIPAVITVNIFRLCSFSVVSLLKFWTMVVN